MKILDLVKMNDEVVYVIDKIPELTYEKYGRYLIGSDKTGVFWDCLGYEQDRYARAFGGRVFKVKMKDGSEVTCDGDYWCCSVPMNFRVEHSIALKSCGYNTLDGLSDCYGFYNGLLNILSLMREKQEFLEEHPDYRVWEYHEYKKHLQG